MRREFAKKLYDAMKKDERIFLITAPGSEVLTSR